MSVSGVKKISGARGPYPEQFSPRLDLAPYDGPVSTYLIASTPRSGSHFLGHALKEAGPFGVPLEYLHPKNLKLWARRFGTTGAPATLEQIMRHRTGATGWFGLKAHWSQFAPFHQKHGVEPLGDLRSIFWIYRRDLLGQAISFTIADQTGQWISGAPRAREPVYAHGEIVRNAYRLRDQNAGWTRFLANHPARHIEVAYEDLVDPAKGDALIGRMLATLSDNVRPAPARSDRVQRQGGSLNDAWRAEFLARVAGRDGWIVEPYR